MSVTRCNKREEVEVGRYSRLLAHRHRCIILNTLGIPLRQPRVPPLRVTDTRRLTSRGDGGRGGGDTLDVRDARDFFEGDRETARSPAAADSSRYSSGAAARYSRSSCTPQSWSMSKNGGGGRVPGCAPRMNAGRPM